MQTAKYMFWTLIANSIFDAAKCASVYLICGLTFDL